MLLLLMKAWAAPVVGPVVEPVATHAELDRRHVRATPLLSMGSAAGPILYGLGHLSVSLRVRRDVPIVLDQGAAISGVLLMTTAPSLLAQRANRSRKALVAQGLKPTRYPLYLTFILTTAGAVFTFAGLQDSMANIRKGQRERWRFTAVGAGLWGVGISLPILQLRANRRARKRAGWWTR